MSPTNKRSRALADRLHQDAAAALELYTVYLGERLGLYRSLAEHGPTTSTELAEYTDTTERYIREWLEHHAVSGLLDVDDTTADPLDRRYYLPSEYISVLTDPNDLHYQAFQSIEIARAARRLPDLVEAFRSGDAPPPLPWEPEGRASPNRQEFMNLLGKKWLPAIPDVARRLRNKPPARVADFACGTGWSSIAMAQAFPRITVHGFDLDEDAIVAAREHAEESGLSDRVTFSVADAAEQSEVGSYDVVTILEALHDMSRPVEALRRAREMLVPGGTVLVLDELVEPEFTAPGPELERYHYAWSLMSCLPGAMGDPESAATGAVMRPSTLRRYATEAGFAETQVLPIKTEFWTLYRLVP